MSGFPFVAREAMGGSLPAHLRGRADSSDLRRADLESAPCGEGDSTPDAGQACGP